MRPLQAEIMIEKLHGFRGQGEKPFLIAFPMHTDLRFRQKQILAIQIQDFPGAQSLQQHETDDGQIARGAKAGPEPGHLVH